MVVIFIVNIVSYNTPLIVLTQKQIYNFATIWYSCI